MVNILQGRNFWLDWAADVVHPSVETCDSPLKPNWNSPLLKDPSTIHNIDTSELLHIKPRPPRKQEDRL